MSRLFFLIAIAAAVYLLIKSFRNNNAPKQDDAVAEDMLRCTYCGVHLPKSESIQAQGQTFCSPAHRDACLK